MRSNAVLVVLSLMLPSSYARAEALVEASSGVSFQRRPTIDGKPYLCLGVGLRKKLVFKGFAISFCVEEIEGKAQLARYFEREGKKHAALAGEALTDALMGDPEFFKAMIALPVAKAAELVFLRDVPVQRFKEGIEESFTRALGPGEKVRIDGFLRLLDRNFKEKDHLVLRTRPNGEITVGLGLAGPLRTMTDPLLATAIWEPYLGADTNVSFLKRAVAAGVAAQRP